MSPKKKKVVSTSSFFRREMADDAPAAAACPASSASPPLPPLLERVGGMTALVNAVDVFYSRILDDPTLAPFFEGVEMSRQRTKQVNGERGRGFFCFVRRRWVFSPSRARKNNKKRFNPPRSSSSATPSAARACTSASRSSRPTSASSASAASTGGTSGPWPST